MPAFYQSLRIHKYNTASVVKEFIVWSVKQTDISRITPNFKFYQGTLSEAIVNTQSLGCQQFPRVLNFPITNIANIKSQLSFVYFLLLHKENCFEHSNSDWDCPKDNSGTILRFWGGAAGQVHLLALKCQPSASKS